ncbi:TSUP family transporter [Parahaliea mediterranea]|nr:TSUP family transporter [Parahaliea mediterranea]
MLTDPYFYLVSVPAVLLYGIAKGGFGGAIAMVSVPMMALVMSPTQAAAILLPILVVMDAVVVKTYWGHFDRRALRILLPGALCGVALGYLSAESMSEDWMRVLIGIVALVFGANFLLSRSAAAHKPHNRVSAAFFGGLAGFTSFSIHAGGPPLTVYLLPRGLAPLLFAGTAGMFFAVVNAVKLLPYYLLGQFSGDNLLYSLALVPLAPLGVWIGRFLVERTEPRLYYGIISAFLVLVGLRLLWLGASGVLASPAVTMQAESVLNAIQGVHRMNIVELAPGVGASEQIDPRDMPAIAAAGYKVVLNNRPDGEVPGQPGSAEIAAAAAAHGLEYRYLPVTAMNFPGAALADVAAAFDGDGPVLAYCRSGTRSTNLWVVSRPAGERADARERARQLGYDLSMADRLLAGH